jgi:DNA-binding CsgD family transcriptional regulator
MSKLALFTSIKNSYKSVYFLLLQAEKELISFFLFYMTTDSRDYSLFMRFLEAYTPVGFKGINPTGPLIVEMEKMMERNDQFIYIADIIQIRVLFTSKRSIDMLGVEPEKMTPYYFMEATHPDDIERLSVGRARLIEKAQDLFIAGTGTAFLSTNFRVRNASGHYSNLLMQNYLYFSEIPYKTVFYLKVHTNIDWCRKIKCGYHYHTGSDMSYFRYPDDELLQTGNVFTKREFEIIKLIEKGQSSEQIAEKLFLSTYTVNTHRGNILKKTGKTHISELIYELQERGML